MSKHTLRAVGGASLAILMLTVFAQMRCMRKSKTAADNSFLGET